MSDYIKKQDVLDILYNTFEEYNMTTDKQDKHGGFGAEVFKRVKEQPTLDEKEIIRKAFERVVERLEEMRETFDDEWLRTLSASAYQGRETIDMVKQVIKEEGGIE